MTSSQGDELNFIPRTPPTRDTSLRVTFRWNRPFCSAFLAALVLASPLASRAQSPGDDVAQLKAQVESLQKATAEQSAKISALEKKNAATVDQELAKGEGARPGAEAAPTTPTQPSFVVNRNSRSPAQKLTPRIDNVPITPVEKGYVRFQGTEVDFEMGGSASTVLTVSSKAFSPTWMVTAAIPVSGQPFYDSQAQVAFTANESDINFQFRMPSPLGQLRIVYNNDFSQPQATFNYHLRYFYAQAGNLLVGFSDSLFTDVDSFPATLDYEGPNALPFYRHAMVSYGLLLHRDEDRQVFFKVSVEFPSAQVSPAALVPRNVSPDVGAQLRLEGKHGHVQLATILRGIGIQSATDGSTQTVFGWGLNLTAGLNLWGGDFLSAGVAGGQGVAAYFNDTGGGGLDAAIAAGGALTALPILGVFAGYTHRWAPEWSSTASYGFLTMNDSSYQASLGSTGFQQTQYASLNLAWRPWSRLLVGVEGLYGFRKAVDASTGDAWRGQTNVQFNF